jgi:hypothetical protein
MTPLTHSARGWTRGNQKEEEKEEEKEAIPEEKLAQMAVRRKHIANEIFTTETTYVTDLTAILKAG